MRTPAPFPFFLLALALLLPGLSAPCGAEVYVLDFDTTPPAGRLSAADIPSGSGRYVIDEPGSLSPELRLKTEAALAENSNAPTYLVIKKGRLPVATDLFANELLRRWIVRGRRLGALVMTVTEPLPETHVILAGRKLAPIDIRRLHELGAAALALSAEHSSQAEGASVVALALVPALATFAEAYDDAPAALTAPAAAPSKSTGDAPKPAATDTAAAAADYVPKTSSHWDQLSSELDWPLIRAVAAIVGGVMALVLGAIFLPRALNRRRFYFPEVEPRTRFSAPFAGGSNAQIKFRP